MDTTVKVLLLGAAQDGGVPQAGCVCAVCDRARTAPAPSYLVCSLGVIDYHEGLFWLVDATPDLRTQLHLLQSHATGCRLAGILITHAHMGHYTGLIHLGREAMNARNLPLYGTPAFGSFLQSNAPWKQLVETGNVAWRAVQPGQGLQLTPRLNVTPVAVPHRAEYTDTVGYLLRGPSRAMFYCPDIDGWSQWGRDVRAFLAQFVLFTSITPIRCGGPVRNVPGWKQRALQLVQRASPGHFESTPASCQRQSRTRDTAQGLGKLALVTGLNDNAQQAGNRNGLQGLDDDPAQLVRADEQALQDRAR